MMHEDTKMFLIGITIVIGAMAFFFAIPFIGRLLNAADYYGRCGDWINTPQLFDCDYESK